jgi:hypothetical protein
MVIRYNTNKSTVSRMRKFLIFTFFQHLLGFVTMSGKSALSNSLYISSAFSHHHLKLVEESVATYNVGSFFYRPIAIVPTYNRLSHVRLAYSNIKATSYSSITGSMSGNDWWADTATIFINSDIDDDDHFRNLMLHEFLHVFGWLYHSHDPRSVSNMTFYVSPDKKIIRAEPEGVLFRLSVDDVVGIMYTEANLKEIF